MYRKILFLTVSMLALSIGRAQTFSDNFSGASIDSSKWNVFNNDPGSGDFIIDAGTLDYHATAQVNDWATWAMATKQAFNRTNGSGGVLQVTVDINISTGYSIVVGLTTANT